MQAQIKSGAVDTPTASETCVATCLALLPGPARTAGSKDIPVGATVAVLVEEQGDVAAFANYTGSGERLGAAVCGRGRHAAGG